MAECTAEEEHLIRTAHAMLRRHYAPDRHEIGAALWTAEGREFAAVNLDVRLGRAAVCAEAIAIGMAVAAGDRHIESIVAVNIAGKAVSPCGVCRELLADYAPNARVILPGEQGPEVLSIRELLPRRYRKDGELDGLPG